LKRESDLGGEVPMPIISTSVHGYIDYVTGAFLIVSPYLFGFATGGPAQWVAVLIGMAIIVFSALTDYEHGIVRLIPMPVHLMLDVAGGFLLVAAPWLFGFADQVFWPHLVVGVASVIIPIFTARQPRARTTHVPHG
jgi:hypothetical protein